MTAATKALEKLAPLALTLTLFGALLGPATGVEALTWIAAGGLMVYLAVSFPLLKFKGRAFLLLSVGLAVVAELVLDKARQTLGTALTRAAFIATLYTALGFLREAAETSPMVRNCGMFLAAQQPGRRYLALTMGGQVFGMILNFGVIPLLGAMINASVGTGDDWRTHLRRRRMLTAVLRGFSGVLAWSPMTVSLAVVLSSLPMMEWSDFAPWGLGTALGLLVLGWMFDRAIRPPRTATAMAGDRPRPVGNWAMTLPIIGLVLLVFGLGALWTELTGVPLVLGVMTAAPVTAALWLVLQYRDSATSLPGAVRLGGTRLIGHARERFPTYRLEITLLASAAFVGSLIAALLPPDLIRAIVTEAPLPPWALVAALAWVIVALGQLGMNPVLSVTILSGALPSPDVLGLPPVVVAVALTGAWAITANTSPFSAATLVTGQMAGVTAETVGQRWNGLYAVASLTLLSGWIGLATAALS